ncbi:MAG: DUF4367 domain-containing protein [Ruminococcaceae bacterium]|nr:DUF4367 domain-containing protein [Oscillospiraceae bacterium]
MKTIDREKDYYEKMDEALLKHIANVAEDELLAEMEDEEFVFSQRHEKQMEKLFAAVAPKKKKQGRPAVRVLLVAAVLLALAAVGSIAHNENKQRLYTDTTETNTEIRREEVSIAEADVVEGTYETEDLTLGYVPKGMQMTESSRNDTSFSMKFQRNEDFFQLRVWKRDMVYNMDNQQSDMERIQIGNSEGYIQEKDGNISIKWYTEERVYALLGSLEKDELIKIAEKIQ